PEQREYLTLARRSGEALLAVINDILDFSKVEAGKLDLDRVPFRLRESLDDTLSALALRARQKGLELACRIDPDVPEGLVGDPGRLRQVLVNLVGNAVKFTERGEVVVRVEREAHSGERAEGSGEAGAPRSALHTLLFSVRDTGIGIPADKQQ